MKSQFPTPVLHRIQRCGVIAVLVIDDAKHAVPVAEALLRGGIDVMELTLRTPAAIESLKAIAAQVPEMLAGIGTILTAQQVEMAVEADAAFGVAPGLNRNVVLRAQELGLPFAPGVLTPSEVERAVELGCRELKFFPAEPGGGVNFLQSMNAPFAHLGLNYIPLGGLNSANMGSYLCLSIVSAIGGSWIAPRDLIQKEDWKQISTNAMDAKRILDEIQQ